MKVFLKAKWENIIMANYQIEPELLLPFLPKGVSLDLYQGKAYVSLVGFMFKTPNYLTFQFLFLDLLKK